MILDVFSRYVVGWTVQYRENADLAKALIEQAAEQQQITFKVPTLHADHGAPACPGQSVFSWSTSASLRRIVALTPRVTTLKYRPEFPARFDNIEHARAHCRVFFDWYNHTHRHSGIGLMKPAAIHYAYAAELRAARARVLNAAYQRHPERFVRKPPVPPEPPTAAWINKPNEVAAAH